MAAERELTLKITGDARGLSRAFGKVQKESGRMEGGLRRTGRAFAGLGKAAAIATTAVAAAGLVMGKKAADAASDLEEAVNKSNEVFERSGPAMLKWADDAATAMGMSRDAALDGAASFGAMLKPMGVAPQQAAVMSRKMTELASDMASFNNEDPTEMLDRLRAGLSGESEPLKRFGSVLSETRVKQFAYAQGIAETGEKLTEQQKIQARYGLLLKDTADQQGDFARTSDGMANAQRIASAQLRDTAAVMGRILIPIVAKGLSAFNDFVAGVQERWPQIQAAVAPVIERVKETIGIGVDFIRARWDSIVSAALMVWERVKQTFDAAVAALRPVVEGLVGIFRENWDRIVAVTRSIFDEVMKTVDSVVRTVRPLLDQLVDLFRATLDLVLTFWEEWGEGLMTIVRRVFQEVAKVVRPLLQTLQAIIETVTAAIEGDWGRVWEGIKDIVRNALKALAQIIRSLAGLLFDAMKWAGGKLFDGLKGIPARMVDAGKAIVGAIISGIKAAPGALMDAIMDLVPTPADIVDAMFGGNRTTSRSLVNSGSGGIGFQPGSARGALLPGTYQGRDTMIGALAPGEAILTPRQQGLVDSGVPIRQALAMTGGRVGGRAFALGGVVGSFYKRAVDQLREPYGKPSLGQSRTGPNSWDCSGYATFVAGVNVGGTTATAYRASSKARGGELVVWGFRNDAGGYGASAYDGGYDEHMGVGVADPRTGKIRWFDAGSGGVESNSDSARWMEVRVPAGLERLNVASLGGGVNGAVGPSGGSDDTRANTRGRGQRVELNDRQKLARLLGQATGRRGLGKGRAVADWAKPLVNRLSTDVPDVSSNTTGANFTGAQQRAISGAARTARSEARGAGKSPQEVREAGEEAERKAEALVLRRMRRQAIQRRAGLQRQKAKLLRRWQALTRKPARGKQAVLARRKATRQVKAKLRQFTAEIADMAEIIAEVNERLAELNEQAIEAEHEANYEALAGGDGAGDAGVVDVPEPPSELDSLNANMAMARLTEGTGDDLQVARNMLDFTQRQYREALASGDTRRIGAAASDLRSAMDQVKSLAPSTDDFMEFQRIAAQLTEGTEDDLAVARAIEAMRAKDVEKAMATGDPRLASAAIQALISARQSREALEENTDAMKDNTDALRGFAGSTTFSFRGQDFVLRSLAPPSSDRLENLGVGA